ncbi:MAG TPA: hypothetical protein DCR20_04855 [Planctomycetaceae bacterium]|nr:hypothetical protein [Planctomycetaceae bacterium]
MRLRAVELSGRSSSRVPSPPVGSGRLRSMSDREILVDWAKVTSVSSERQQTVSNAVLATKHGSEGMGDSFPCRPGHGLLSAAGAHSAQQQPAGV